MLDYYFSARRKRRLSKWAILSAAIASISFLGWINRERIHGLADRIECRYWQRECLRYEAAGQIVYTGRRNAKPDPDAFVKWSMLRPESESGTSDPRCYSEFIQRHRAMSAEIDLRGPDSYILALHRRCAKGGLPVLLVICAEPVRSDLGATVYSEDSTGHFCVRQHCDIFVDESSRAVLKSVDAFYKDTWQSLVVSGASFSKDDESRVSFTMTVDGAIVTFDGELQFLQDHPDRPYRVVLNAH